MKNRRNYYRLLQVQPDAPVEVIRSSFRALMRELGRHPDRGGSHAEAVLLNEAYATLTDVHRREEYDCLLRQTQPGQFHGNRAASNSGTASSAEAFNIWNHGRRSYGRMQREERIDFWTESTGKAEGIMLDFSPTGLLLLCAVPLPEQAHIRLSTSLFIATGRVTHCTEQTAQRPSRFAVGVAFSEVQFENSTGSLLSATI